LRLIAEDDRNHADDQSDQWRMYMTHVRQRAAERAEASRSEETRRREAEIRRRERLTVAELQVKAKAGMRLSPAEITILAKADLAAADEQAETERTAAAMARQEAQAAQDAARAQAARQAEATCEYRSDTATMQTPGLWRGVLAGVLESASCRQYFRRSGILE